MVRFLRTLVLSNFLESGWIGIGV